MCDQGFNPSNADYDNRTALMVASMKGNKDVVELLLEYQVRSFDTFLKAPPIDLEISPKQLRFMLAGRP
jgi:ankyrin repeat protein